MAIASKFSSARWRSSGTLSCSTEGTADSSDRLRRLQLRVLVAALGEHREQVLLHPSQDADGRAEIGVVDLIYDDLFRLADAAANRGDQRVALFGEEHELDAPVIVVGATRDKSGIFQPVDQAPERDLAKSNSSASATCDIPSARERNASTHHCDQVTPSGFSARSTILRLNRDTSWTRNPNLSSQFKSCAIAGSAILELLSGARALFEARMGLFGFGCRTVARMRGRRDDCGHSHRPSDCVARRVPVAKFGRGLRQHRGRVVPALPNKDCVFRRAHFGTPIEGPNADDFSRRVVQNPSMGGRQKVTDFTSNPRPTDYKH
jgi:hypothetical protein